MSAQPSPFQPPSPQQLPLELELVGGKEPMTPNAAPNPDPRDTPLLGSLGHPEPAAVAIPIAGRPFFHRAGIWTAWEFDSQTVVPADPNEQPPPPVPPLWSPEQFANMAYAAGAGFALFQDTAANGPAAARACQARGVDAVVWQQNIPHVLEAVDVLHRYPPGTGYCGVIEGPGRPAGFAPDLRSVVGSDVPLAIATNFADLDRAELASYVAAGFDVMLECYERENPGGTVAGQLDYALRVLSVPHAFLVPIVEAGEEKRLADYELELRAVQPLTGFSVWIGGELRPPDWAAFSRLAQLFG